MLAQRTNLVPVSEIRKMYNKVIDRPNAINLTVGQPDFETPDFIKEAGKKAIDDGITRYTHNAGLLEVRESFSHKVKRDNSIDADPVTEIICTAGGMGSLILANQVLVDPGDEVLYPDPGFVSHKAHIHLAGGVPIPVPLRKENNFGMTAADVEERITDKTKLLVINSPNNPTGGVSSNKDIKQISELAIENDFYILSDEAYEKFRYDSEKPLFIGSLPDMKSRCVTLFSFSKSYAMTGWRIGFSVGPEEVIKAMTHMQEHFLAMPTSISQKAAQAAVDGCQDCVGEMLATYRKRRDLITKGLNSIDGITMEPPDGAFYAFPDLSFYSQNSYEFANELLDKANVATVHGSAFGQYGEGFLRMCYAVSTEEIETALQYLDTYLSRLP